MIAFGMDTQYQDRQVGVSLPDLADHIREPRPGHRDVEQDRIHGGRGQVLEHGVPVRRLGDDLHVPVLHDHALDSLTDDRMVVGDEQPDHAPPSTASCPRNGTTTSTTVPP